MRVLCVDCDDKTRRIERKSGDVFLYPKYIVGGEAWAGDYDGPSFGRRARWKGEINETKLKLLSCIKKWWVKEGRTKQCTLQCGCWWWWQRSGWRQTGRKTLELNRSRKEKRKPKGKWLSRPPFKCLLLLLFYYCGLVLRHMFSRLVFNISELHLRTHPAVSQQGASQFVETKRNGTKKKFETTLSPCSRSRSHALTLTHAVQLAHAAHAQFRRSRTFVNRVWNEIKEGRY